MLVKKLRYYLDIFFENLDRRFYSGRKFVIISNNCWGAEIYKRLGREYNTPFVGLFIYGPDFLKLLKNFDFYINQQLQFKKESMWTDKELTYPIGYLSDIEIHFMHYKTKEEAELKWKRRLKRMKLVKNKNNYYYKICDRDFSNRRILEQFHELPFKNKISFAVFELENKNHIQLSGTKGDKFSPDGVKLFKLTHNYFDLFCWLKKHKIQKTFYNNLKVLLKTTC